MCDRLINIAIAKTEQEMAESNRAVRVLLAALRDAIGWDADVPLRLKGRTANYDVPDVTLDSCEAMALRYRVEVSQTALARRLHRHDLSRRKARYVPDLAAFAGLSHIADDRNYVNPNDDHEWFVGISLTLPIFTGFSRPARVAEARSNLRRAELVATQVRRAISLQVREAYHSLKAAQSKVDAAEKMVEEAARLREITEGARAQHIGTDYQRMLLLSEEPEVMEFRQIPDLPDELEADIMETESKTNRLKAIFEVKAARARLARAMGVRSFGGLTHEQGD